MHNSDTSGLQVIKKQDKEPRVTAFVKDHLSRRRKAGDNEPAEYLLIARSPLSPVCRALANLASILEKHNISVRAVFTTIEDDAELPEAANFSKHFEPAVARLVDDARLFEAHEQLVLDTETCWIGDCMRREPSKRDAYECYATTAEEIASAATKAFSSFWRQGRPASRATRLAAPVVVGSGTRTDLPSSTLPSDDLTPPTAATRH